MTSNELRMPPGEISETVCAGLGTLIELAKSPIERVFLAALLRQSCINSMFYETQVRFGTASDIRSLRERPAVFDIDALFFRPTIFVGLQHEIGKYKADFVLIGCHFTYEGSSAGHMVERGRRSRAVVVECDGHDFHERTKEQAAHDRGRDRFMQDEGYAVLRFTGSELHRDPAKCASEAINFIVKELEAANG